MNQQKLELRSGYSQRASVILADGAHTGRPGTRSLRISRLHESKVAANSPHFPLKEINLSSDVVLFHNFVTDSQLGLVSSVCRVPVLLAATMFQCMFDVFAALVDGVCLLLVID